LSSYNQLLNYLDLPTQENTRKHQLRNMIPIEQWLEDPYYLGPINLFPYWKEKIIQFYNNNYNSIIFTGSTRSGKSFIASILLIRQLYELSVYSFQYGSAALKFGLDPSTPISMLILSTTIVQAETVSLAPLRRMIDNIPYFIENFPRDYNIKSTLSFDDGRILIRPVASYITSLLGINMISVLLDEMNFINGAESGFSDALDIYSEATSRIQQTFSTGEERTYGFKILISSADQSSSFVESVIESEQDNPKTYIVKSKRFEITPEKFKSEKFYIFAGEKNIQPFIIDYENKKQYSDLLDYLAIPEEEKQIYLDYEDITEVTIPEKYSDLFEYPPVDFYNKSIDVTRILRDVCGRSLGSMGNFFSNIVAFNNCLYRKIEHPFINQEFVCSTENQFNELIEQLKPDFFGNKRFKYTISLDLAKRYDCVGLALGHFDPDIGKQVIDFMIKIHPPENKSHHIKFKAIQEFVEYLINKRNFRIDRFYCDGYQSDFLIEHFSSPMYKMEAKIISVDRTDKQYIYMKDIILNNGVYFYEYEPFRKEFFNLHHNMGEGFVDHPASGSKDISDAVCRLIYTLGLNNSSVSNTKLLTPTIKELIRRRNNFERKNITVNDIIKIEQERFNKQNF